MVSSVAVLSDIHGVMPALDAVLAEPDLQRADRIVLTGDIAAGPQPTEVLDRLLGLGDKVVWVRGNADRESCAAGACELRVWLDGSARGSRVVDGNRRCGCAGPGV